MDDRLKKTMRTMFFGSFIYNVLLLIIAIIVSILLYGTSDIIKILKVVLSVCIGFICTLVAIYSMAVTIANAVKDGDEKYAKIKVAKTSVIRMVTFCIILIIILKSFGYLSALMLVLSIIGIKVGAYYYGFISRRK